MRLEKLSVRPLPKLSAAFASPDNDSWSGGYKEGEERECTNLRSEELEAYEWSFVVKQDFGPGRKNRRGAK